MRTSRPSAPHRRRAKFAAAAAGLTLPQPTGGVSLVRVAERGPRILVMAPIAPRSGVCSTRSAHDCIRHFHVLQGSVKPYGFA